MKIKTMLAVLLATVVLFPVSASAYPTIGVSKLVADYEDTAGRVVCATVSNNIYSSPDSDSEVIGRILANQLLKVADNGDGFYRIRVGSAYGYVEQDCFVYGVNAVFWIRNSPAWFKQNVIVEESTTAYEWLSGEPLVVLDRGETLQLKEKSGDFYVCIYTEVADDGTENNMLVNVECNDCRLVYDLRVTYPGGCYSGKGMDIAEYACSFVGCPYVWGGTEPKTGADCSGFVQYVYKSFGYDLPRTSWMQAESGISVPLDDLEPGDLIFYQRGDRIGHVTMYIGDGMVVQARGTGYGICITPYDYSTPCCARRIIE